MARSQVLTICVSIVMAFAAALMYSAIRQLPAPRLLLDDELSWWWLAAPFALGNGVQLRFRLGSAALFLSIVEFPFVIALLTMDGPSVLAAHLVGVLVAMVCLGYRSTMILFNLTAIAVETTGAIVLFHAIADRTHGVGLLTWLGSLLAMTMCAAACALRTQLLVVIRRQPRSRGWVAFAGVACFVAAMNTTLAFLAVRLVVADPRLTWLVGGLAVVIVVVYRNYIALLNHHEGLDRLYESTQTFELITAHESSIRTMLDQALELLGGEEAELVLLAGVGGRRFVATRLESAHAAPDGGGAAVVDTPALDGSERPERATPTESEDGRTLLATLHGSAGPLAVLRVSTDRGLRFSEGDRRLFEMFVNHASVALQNSQLVDQLRDEVAQREHEALHDALTALPNRVMFDLQTRRALAGRAEDEVVAVALVDIDHFKEVNDTLGHDHGDELLAEIARRLERLAAERTLVVSRLGGDEFAVLMTTSGGIDHVANTAAEVKSVIEASVDIADVRVDITASVGISVTDPNGEGVDGSTMLRQADVAMYIAKGQHLGTVFYDRADDPYSPKRLSLAADLRHAVERGEIEAYFQPEIDLVTGDVISVEALARWTHPEHGNIVPDQFIPIAEQSGLIRDLTYLMLKQSLERIRQWRSHGFDLHVAVNLSVRCLSDEHLVERVMRQLELAGLGPDCLTLEVTEGTIMADPEHALAVLGRLHDQGIRLSIDDFGMGYSSLAQLKRMPVGQLKVDRSFVTYVSEDHDDAAIVKSVTDLGHNLGLEVIAEGVEDQQTLDKLIELGCDSVQGFYLARPMSADQTLRWLRDRQRQRREPGYDPKFAIAQIV